MRRAVPERKAETPEACVAPARRASSAPVRAASGLRPGILRSPARSWLTWVLGALPGEDARPGMGRNRKAGLKEATPSSATSAARRREPASRLPAPRRGTGHQGKRRDGAPEGAPAPVWAGISGPDLPEMGATARRATGAPDMCTSDFLRSISPHLFGRDEKKEEAPPARHDKRAAQR